MNDYQAANDYAAPRAIKKEDCAPTIDRFIDDHTTQIDQLRAESKTLTKGTPEYAENEAKRRKLASERSSAKRLVARYFNVPKTESSTPESDTDEGINMEEAPAGKTKEQIEAKKRQDEEAFQKRLREYWEQKRQGQQEKPPTSYFIEGRLVDKDTTITVGQKIPDDWFETRKYGSVDNSGFGLNITRPPKIDDCLTHAVSVEFGKLSEDERQHYNYPALCEAVRAEARRTKRVPDIVGIINQQRAINDQREKVKQSYGQGTSQRVEEELEDRMSM